jgi:hypothetical protein
MESEIKAVLMSLLDGIKRADGSLILRRLTELDTLLDNGRGRLHPQLVHFLEGRSYAKAAAWLEGEPSIPAGACGRRQAEGA